MTGDLDCPKLDLFCYTARMSHPETPLEQTQRHVTEGREFSNWRSGSAPEVSPTTSVRKISLPKVSL